MWPVRGHQVPADHHPLQFRTAAEFGQYTRDLSVFGTNMLELSHVPQPFSVDGLGAFADACSAAGMNASIWGAGSLWASNSTLSAQVFQRMQPALSSIFFPGGDGGTLDWGVVDAVAAQLRAARGAGGSADDVGTVWVSAQELSGEAMEVFWANVTLAVQSTPRSLAGLVYGPHVRVPLTGFSSSAATVAAKTGHAVPVRQYPDITHTLSDQFPLHLWDPAWSLTHGRQTVCPLPRWSARVIGLRSTGSTPTVGVGAYSEGLGDDLNKAVWSALAQDPSLSLRQVVVQYSRYFFGAGGGASNETEEWADALFGLEENWVGSPGKMNAAIPRTLSLLQKLVEKPGAGTVSKDWRAQMYLKRAYFDSYVQRRYIHEVELNEAAAWKALAAAKATGSREAIAGVREALARPDPSAATTAAYRARILELSSALNASVGDDVLGNQDPSLNLKTIDTPLSDSAFLRSQMQLAEELRTESARLDFIRALVNHTDPGPGGFYDDLGSMDTALAPRLDQGQGAEADPSFFFTPLRVGPTMPNAMDFSCRRSWSSYSMSFFDSSAVRLRYEGLSANLTYAVHIVFNALQEPFGDGNTDKMRVVATTWPRPGPAVTVWPHPPLQYGFAPSPMTKTVVPIPHALTAGGGLSLRCNQPPGVPGNGRTCQISAVWLVVV
jgi:hypothetical protein